MRNSSIRMAFGKGIIAQYLLVPSLLVTSCFSDSVFGQNRTSAGGSGNQLPPSGFIQDRTKTIADGGADGSAGASGFADTIQENTAANIRKVPASGSTPQDTAATQDTTTEGTTRIQNGNSLNRSATLSNTAGNWPRSQVKISVDFPGGTIGEYVDVVKKEADSLNLIVTESAKELKLPKIALKNVPVHVAIKCIEQCFDPSKTIVRVGGEIEGVQFIQAEIVSTNQVEVINVRHLISGTKNVKEKENFLAAVETGLQMQSETTKNLKIKFHEETGLLFLSGDRSEISLVQQIVSELSPKYVGGMSGSGGDMMGSGGYGMGGMSGMGMPPGRTRSGGGDSMMSGFGGPSGAESKPRGSGLNPGFNRGTIPPSRGAFPGTGRSPASRGDSYPGDNSALPRGGSSPKKTNRSSNRGASTGSGAEDFGGESGIGLSGSGSRRGGSLPGEGSESDFDRTPANGAGKKDPTKRTSGGR